MTLNVRFNSGMRRGQVLSPPYDVAITISAPTGNGVLNLDSRLCLWQKQIQILLLPGEIAYMEIYV